MDLIWRPVRVGDFRSAGGPGRLLFCSGFGIGLGEDALLEVGLVWGAVWVRGRVVVRDELFDGAEGFVPGLDSGPLRLRDL